MSKRSAINNISVSASELSVDIILKRLKEDGVIVIDKYLNQSDVDSLNKEFDLLLKHQASWVDSRWNSLGECVCVDRVRMDSLIYPTTYKVFSSAFMQNVTHAFLGNNCDFNSGIYVCRDVVGAKHNAHDLHFDVERSLKFYIYLHDTDSTKRAFHYVPGSHRLSQQIRKKYGIHINYKNLITSRELPVKDGEALPLEAEAGALIIFDTDVFHKAGNIDSGERRIMRAHTMDIKTIVKKSTSAKKTLSGNIFSKLKLFMQRKK